MKQFYETYKDDEFVSTLLSQIILLLCLVQNQQRCLFQKSLRQNGIFYTLRPERLAYYGYYMFFFWLTWLIRCADAEEVENFFKEYGGERTEYADFLWEKLSDGSPAL